jgi:hypothetical protein
MGFIYFDNYNSFSTTNNKKEEVAAISIQNWWKRKNCNFKNKEEIDASILIQKWWKKNRDVEYYYLFIENSNFYIEELYNRLLTIVIPGIDYICIKKKDTFPKCILIKTNLHKAILNNEIKEVLRLVGYNYQFVLNKN